MESMNNGTNYNKVPERWEAYTNMSRQIPGTRFISFKVPLREAIMSKVQNAGWFCPRTLMDHCQQLGLVVDLTNTYRYYEPKEFVELGIEYAKLCTEGKVIPNTKAVHKFINIVNNFLKRNKNNDKVIGVHCTHGLNRSGYMICRYMIHQLGIPPDQAIADFNSARGHEQEREEYLRDLRQSPWINEVVVANRDPAITSTRAPLLFNPSRAPLLHIPTRASLLDTPTRASLLNNPTRGAPLLETPTQAPLLKHPIRSPLLDTPGSGDHNNLSISWNYDDSKHNRSLPWSTGPNRRWSKSPATPEGENSRWWQERSGRFSNSYNTSRSPYGQQYSPFDPNTSKQPYFQQDPDYTSKQQYSRLHSQDTPRQQYDYQDSDDDPKQHVQQSSPYDARRYYDSRYQGRVAPQYQHDFYQQQLSGVGPQRVQTRWASKAYTEQQSDHYRPRQYRGPRPYHTQDRREEEEEEEAPQTPQIESKDKYSGTPQQRLSWMQTSPMGPKRHALSPGANNDVFSPDNFLRRRSARWNPY